MNNGMPEEFYLCVALWVIILLHRIVAIELVIQKNKKENKIDSF